MNPGSVQKYKSHKVLSSLLFFDMPALSKMLEVVLLNGNTTVILGVKEIFV